MKILLINYEYPPVGGGASNATKEIARALLEIGHCPVILTTRYKHRHPDRNSNLKLIEVPAIRQHQDRSNIFEMLSFLLSASWQVRRIVNEQSIDGIVAFFSIPSGPVALWSWHASHVPYVISLRGGDVPGKEPGLKYIHLLLRPLRRSVFKHAQCIIANSYGLKLDSEGVDPFPVQVVPNGVDTDFWSPKDTNKKSSSFQFVFVGRFHAQKNLPLLLTIFSKLALGLDFELNMVGDGPEANELRELALKLRIDRRIHWLGWKSREALLNIYRKSDCLINLSKYEGMSNVLLEAMACAVPAVVSKAAGNEEVVIDNETGWFLPNENIDDCVSLLSKLVENPGAIRRAGLLARERVLHQASWKQIAEAYLQKLGIN